MRCGIHAISIHGILIPFIMAAKKNTQKPAPKKGKAKPAIPSGKPAAVSKKPVVIEKVKSVKKSALPQKPSPAKKPTSSKKSAPPKKSTPTQKTAPDKKPVVKKSVKKVSTSAKSVEKSAKPDKVVKAVVAAVPVKPEAPVKVAAPVKVPAAKKVPATKPRSSVVDYPAPPAPIKPPFVPPKTAPAPSGEPVPAGSNGTHTPAFIQKQRQRLLDIRDELVDAVSGMARDTIRNAPEGSEASGSGQHQGDAGSDAYDRDFALSVLAKEQDALYEIEQALRRIQSGSYGICEMSSRKIPQTRLEAIPFARLTVECQGQWEKEYGNRRFRPSDEVGFSGGKYVEDEDSESVSLDEDDD